MRLRDAAAGALVLLIAIVGWRLFLSWRTGRVELTTDGEGLVVQVLEEEKDRNVGEPLGLVDRAVIELPEGEYRLRVNGRGRLGRTFRFAVNRGEMQSYSISIDEGRLLGGEPAAEEDGGKEQKAMPVPRASVTGAIVLDRSAGKADLVGWNGKSMIRRDGTTGKVIWDVVAPAKVVDTEADAEWLLWNGSLVKIARSSFVVPAPDLDGDATGDILLNLRRYAAFAAFSGKTGALLWTNREGSSTATARGYRDMPSLSSAKLTVGEPTMTDIDGDGTPDLIATLVLGESSETQKRDVVGISGRTGKEIWRYGFDEAPMHVAASCLERPAVLVQGPGSRLVVYVDGSQWIGLDPQTGKPRVGPIDLGVEPVVPVQHADLDGDGEPEIVALGPEPGGKDRTLRALTIKNGKELWAHRLDAVSDLLLKGDTSGGLPLLLDSDGDGRLEILVRDARPMPPLAGGRGVRLIEGATGVTRWRAVMTAALAGVKDRVSEVIAAPDLDGDGVREIVTVSEFEIENEEATYVDAFSGKDGRRVWSWHVAAEGQRIGIGKPAWWGLGPDGWPLLALPLGGETPGPTDFSVAFEPLAGPIVHLLEASTGRERHRVLGLEKPGITDLDGDGVDDLWGEVDGELRALRGEPPEAWRALGRFGEPGSRLRDVPAILGKLGEFLQSPLPEKYVDPLSNPGVDFDGDGVCDVLTAGVLAPGKAKHQLAGSHVAMARSGRTGRVIWKTGIDPRGSWFDPASRETYKLTALSLPAGDLDGDGTADVIVDKSEGGNVAATGRGETLQIELLSGRTGARIWSGGHLPESSLRKVNQSVWQVAACVVDPKGSRDVIVAQAGQFGGSGSSLARVSGRDGRVLWEAELPEMGASVSDPLLFLDDLDGDGGLDALALIPPMDSGGDHSAVAVSLRDGKRLWTASVELGMATSVWRNVCVGDVDGDKRAEIVSVAEPFPRRGSTTTVRTLDGRDGTLRWKWELPSRRSSAVESRELALANFDGDGTREVCVSIWELNGPIETIVLDSSGKERARVRLGGGPVGLTRARDRIAALERDSGFLWGDGPRRMTAADLDGDGCDELLVNRFDRLHALAGDLKERWFYAARSSKVERVIPAARGSTGTVIMSAGIVLDGATGWPRWVGQKPVDGESAVGRVLPKVLDPGDATTAPLLITGGRDSTICRMAMATAADGSLARAKGKLAGRAYRSGDDPRWGRRLPWVSRMKGAVGLNGILVSGCLALVNVFLPIFLVRLAIGRRRAFKMWALMVMPAVAVVPLVVYQSVTPWLSVGDGRLLATQTRVFLTGTVAGIPVVIYLVLVVGNLVRRRWGAVARVLGLTVLATVCFAIVWVLIDRRAMATGYQHYDVGGWRWLLVMIPGALATAVLWVVRNGVRSILSLTRRGNRVRSGEAAVGTSGGIP